ncbi:hypothetical protein R1flu_016626 [Riccia fluitans]|uniref:Uncharacterized protein n=1 Tax=Riccia fluitans TaxID=41844 RepID=A0ABD1YMJ2_9MARC
MARSRCGPRMAEKISRLVLSPSDYAFETLDVLSRATKSLGRENGALFFEDPIKRRRRRERQKKRETETEGQRGEGDNVASRRAVKSS